MSGKILKYEGLCAWYGSVCMPSSKQGGAGFCKQVLAAVMVIICANTDTTVKTK